MAGNTVTLTFAGDSKSLERSLGSVGGAAKAMASDLDGAGAKAGLTARAIGSAGEAADQSEGKFMATADLLDGLGGAFGLPTAGATNLFRAFGDLSGGFAGLHELLGGGVEKIKAFGQALVSGEIFTKAWAAAQKVFNLVMEANPAILIAGAVIALGLALYAAYQKSETFREVVKKAFDIVKGAAEAVWNFIKSIPEKLMDIGEAIKDAILWPWKTAFNLVAKLWNNTVGKLSFTIPDWVPGVGGKGFSMPKLPEFHTGGIVPGAPGTEVPIMAMAGETVTPAGAARGTTVIQLVVDGRVLTEVVHQGLLAKQKRTPLGLA